MYPEEEDKTEEIAEQPVEDEGDLLLRKRAKAVGFMLTLILRARFKKQRRSSYLVQKYMRGYSVWKEKHWELKEVQRERDAAFVEKQVQWLGGKDKVLKDEMAQRIQRMYHSKI